MARRSLAPASNETDPKSALMSELAAIRYLGTDGKGIVELIKQKRLKRDPVTGAFARVQVERVHDEILRGLVVEETTTANGFRQEPRLS